MVIMAFLSRMGCRSPWWAVSPKYLGEWLWAGMCVISVLVFVSGKVQTTVPVLKKLVFRKLSCAPLLAGNAGQSE